MAPGEIWIYVKIVAVFSLWNLVLLVVMKIIFIGLISMLAKGDFNKKYSNKLMKLRVITQGIIVLIFSIVLLIKFLN